MDDVTKRFCKVADAARNSVGELAWLKGETVYTAGIPAEIEPRIREVYELFKQASACVNEAYWVLAELGFNPDSLTQDRPEMAPVVSDVQKGTRPIGFAASWN